MSLALTVLTPSSYAQTAPADAASANPVNAQSPTPVAHVSLWAKMQRKFSIPHLVREDVLAQMRLMMQRPSLINTALERGSPFLPDLIEQLAQRQLPIDLAVLPVIESAFEARATSPAAAAGVWQFIPSTGKRFGLIQTASRDDRRELLASSRAAFDYLTVLYNLFGDWHLALAAYNCGEGCVARATLRAQRAGRSIDFDGVSPFLPAETQAYVPKFLAVRNIILGAEQYGYSLPAIGPQLVPIAIVKAVDLNALSGEIGTDQSRLLRWNATHRSGILPAYEQTHLWVPQDVVKQTTAWLDKTPAVAVPAFSQRQLYEQTVRDQQDARNSAWLAKRPSAYDASLDPQTAANVQGRLKLAHQRRSTTHVVSTNTGAAHVSNDANDQGLSRLQLRAFKRSTKVATSRTNKN